MNTNIKKILSLVLVVVLTASITLGVTLALLTDETEIKHNVFTAGKVSVELTEKVDGDTYGGVTSDNNGGEYNLVAPGDDLTKEVKVANTGNIPAYVAVTVTMNNALKINQAIDEYYEAQGYSEEKIQAIYDYVFENWGLNHTKTDRNGLPAGMRLTISGSDMPENTLQVDSVKTIHEYWLTYTQNWFGHDDADTVIPYDGYYTEGMEDYELKWTYYLYLEPQEESVLFTGINVPDYFVNEQMAMFDGLEIDIQGAAIQAENFADAKAAFTALRGEQKGTNTPVIPQTSVSNQAELQAAINDGKKIIYLKTGEYDLKGIMSNGLTLVGLGDDVKVANTTRFASGKAVGAITKAITLENVTVTNTIYTMENGSNATFVDVTFAAGVREAYGKNVKFDGCAFGSNADGYALHFQTDSGSADGMITLTDCEFLGGKVHLGGKRAYTFTNCEFAAGTDFQIWSDIILDGCTVDGVEVTAANLNTLFPNLNAAKVTFQ